MQARNLRRMTDRALALIDARLAVLIPANPPGRPPRPGGKPDGQLAGLDGAPDRAPSAARPADAPGGTSQPVGKPDGQLAGSDAGQPEDRVQSAAWPADASGGTSQPGGKPDGQLAGLDGAPDRAPSAARPAETSGGTSQPGGKPDGQLAGSDAGQPEDRVQSAAWPADASGGTSQPVGKPDGQLAGLDGAPDRAPSAARPAEMSGGTSQPAGKPDGQLAGFDAGEPDRVPLPSARTMRDIRAAHPDPTDKQVLRERMDRLANRGARVSRRALIAEVRREQTEPADPPGIDGRPEPVADTRPLPVVHHADLDEHPLDTGSVDAVAMYASDAKDELNPCCPFAETVLWPGGVLLLRCEVGAEEEIHQRVTEEYDNGTPTLAMVHGGHWWPVLVFVRQGDEAHLAERTAYVGDDEQACWRAIYRRRLDASGRRAGVRPVRGRRAHPRRGGRGAAARRRAVPRPSAGRARADGGRTRQGRTAGIDGKVGWPGGGRASGRSAAATRGEDKRHVRVALGAPALPPGGRWIATPADRRGCSHSAKSPGPRLRSLLSPPVRVLSRSDRGGPSRSRRVAGHRLGRLLGSPVRTGPGPSRLRRLTSVRWRPSPGSTAALALRPPW